MSKTADENFMKALHKKVAEAYVKGLEDDMSPAMLSSVSKFLKDNLVVMVPESQGALEIAAEAFNNREFDEPEEKKLLTFPVSKEA